MPNQNDDETSKNVDGKGKKFKIGDVLLEGMRFRSPVTESVVEIRKVFLKKGVFHLEVFDVYPLPRKKRVYHWRVPGKEGSKTRCDLSGWYHTKG